jgi:hypothetical protein
MTDKELQEYMTKAGALRCLIDDASLLANRKKFASGSLGWHFSGKAQILVGEYYLTCQIGLCVTIVGSKPGSPPTAPETPMSLLPPLDPPGATIVDPGANGKPPKASRRRKPKDES